MLHKQILQFRNADLSYIASIILRQGRRCSGRLAQAATNRHNSERGLSLMSGGNAAPRNQHIIHSFGRQASIWNGIVFPWRKEIMAGAATIRAMDINIIITGTN